MRSLCLIEPFFVFRTLSNSAFSAGQHSRNLRVSMNSTGDFIRKFDPRYVFYCFSTLISIFIKLTGTVVSIKCCD